MSSLSTCARLWNVKLEVQIMPPLGVEAPYALIGVGYTSTSRGVATL